MPLVKAVNLEFEGDEALQIFRVLAEGKSSFRMPSAISTCWWSVGTDAQVFIESGSFSFETKTSLLKIFGDIAW